MKKVLLLIIASCIFIFAQEKMESKIVVELKKDIKYLSSKECYGRGIAHDGIFKAEDYLHNELENMGLKVHKQSVRIKMNIPQETPILLINDDTLKAAYDFIPHPYSSSVDARYKKENIKRISHTDLEALKDSLDLISLSSARRFLLKKNKAKADKLLIFEENYPIVSRQNKKYSQVAFQVDKKCLPDSIDYIYAKHNTAYQWTKTHNVLAMIKGYSQADSCITLSAHYDHMGGLGNMYYPGANDNASGVAVLLALARYYAENPPPMTLIFCFFTGEEQGLYGSSKYVKHPLMPLKRNMLTINLDMIGSGHDGWGVVAGKVFPKEVGRLQEIAQEKELGKLKLRDNAKNSDHFSFTDAGSKAVFFYAAGGKQPYHHPDDGLETMDIDVLENMICLMKSYISFR